jgi:hypothetical protein
MPWRRRRRLRRFGQNGSSHKTFARYVDWLYPVVHKLYATDVPTFKYSIGRDPINFPTGKKLTELVYVLYVIQRRDTPT